MSTGVGGQMAWGLQSLSVVLDGAPTCRSPNKTGGLETRALMWAEGAHSVWESKLIKLFLFFPEMIYCLESGRHFPAETGGGGQVRRPRGLTLGWFMILNTHHRRGFEWP